ncbi:MAG: hypothetical protein KC419_08715 [Anaerolineales bacterium]|nr:hypothetical protein [Anaerolineales bacterium]MCA9928546.1 hypothetical protein [Anaerolineales bacterium]
MALIFPGQVYHTGDRLAKERWRVLYTIFDAVHHKKGVEINTAVSALIAAS